ncbi:hypothetical protein SAMN05216525_11191 [Bradyrhizobium sp. Gha]|nr:hypothetical protein SAMN05216525_11191 [Bradyrhizobium sp. Gha]
MTRLMVQAGLNGLIGIGIDRSHGAYLATCEGEVLTNHYLRVIQAEATARAHLGLEPCSVDQVRESLEQLSVQLQPKMGPGLDCPNFNVRLDKWTCCGGDLRRCSGATRAPIDEC